MTTCRRNRTLVYASAKDHMQWYETDFVREILVRSTSEGTFVDENEATTMLEVIQIWYTKIQIISDLPNLSYSLLFLSYLWRK